MAGAESETHGVHTTGGTVVGGVRATAAADCQRRPRDQEIPRLPFTGQIANLPEQGSVLPEQGCVHPNRVACICSPMIGTRTLNLKNCLSRANVDGIIAGLVLTSQSAKEPGACLRERVVLSVPTLVGTDLSPRGGEKHNLQLRVTLHCKRRCLRR